MYNQLQFQPSKYKPINMGVYDYLYSCCTQNTEKIALCYYDKSITYATLLRKIDETANALLHFGVQKGDVVIVSLPSVPEAVYLFYAINKLGAIFCGMDCRVSAEEISEIIEQVKPKICFVSDFHLKEFRNVSSTQIVCLSFARSISVIAGTFSFFADLFWGRTFLIHKKENFFTYNKFISYKNSAVQESAVTIKGEDICAYFYTSGTTYGRKCVILTNDNINSAVLQYSFSQEEFKKMGRFCSIMPLFTCYGISLGTHFPLTLGMQIRMIPLFSSRLMKQILLKEKPSYLITVPSHWEHFLHDKFSDIDLSFLKGAIVGGDKLDLESEQRLNDIFRNCNSTAKVMRGYGLTEASTAVTAQPSDTPPGSVGKEMCWSTIRIFEPGTSHELPAGEKGEICVCGPNICQGYLDDVSATNMLLRQHEDGTTWLHSGDIGYLDENGFLFFCERIKRIYVRYDGTKVSPYAIEQMIMKCPAVSRCLVISIHDKKHAHGKCAKALIVLKKGYTESSASSLLEKHIHTTIPQFMRPVETVFVDKLPVTKSGKLDYFMKEISS